MPEEFFAPAKRIAYQYDGTMVFYRGYSASTPDNVEVDFHEVSTDDLETMNENGLGAVMSLPASVREITFYFPTFMRIEGFFMGQDTTPTLGSTDYMTNGIQAYGSTDTTGMHDGTWEPISAPFDVHVEPLWKYQQHIEVPTYPAAIYMRALRLRTISLLQLGRDFKIHLYGTPRETAPGGELIFQTTEGQELAVEDLWLGNLEFNYGPNNEGLDQLSATIAFRIKNNAGALTALGVGLRIEPVQLPTFWFSLPDRQVRYNGGSWLPITDGAIYDLPSGVDLAPGEDSELFEFRLSLEGRSLSSSTWPWGFPFPYVLHATVTGWS